MDAHLPNAQLRDSFCWYFGVWQVQLDSNVFVVRESVSGAMLMVEMFSNGQFHLYSPALIRDDAYRTDVSYPGLRHVDTLDQVDSLSTDMDWGQDSYRMLRQYSGKIWKPTILADALSHSIWQEAFNDDDTVWHIACVGDHLFLVCIAAAESIQDSNRTGEVHVLFDFHKFSSLVHISDLACSHAAVLAMDVIDMKPAALSQLA